MLDGDFHNWVDASGKVLQIYDPFSLHDGVRDPFAGNVVPKNRFDPQSVKAIAAFSSGPGGQVKPNNGAAPGTVGYVLNNFVTTTGSKIQPADKFSVKLDQYLREKDRISFYYGYNRNLETPGPNGPPTLPGYYTDYNDLNQASNVYRFTWDHNFSPTLLNHFRGGGNDCRSGTLGVEAADEVDSSVRVRTKCNYCCVRFEAHDLFVQLIRIVTTCQELYAPLR
jgi:hypothetical protein